MEIVSINVGARRRLQGRSFDGETGIFKTPVPRAEVGELGLAGDVIVDTKHHGGVDQAVYLYRREDYEWWAGELGRPLDPGTFGENLTVAGLPDPGLAIGSRLRFETVVLEVTAPRIPCNTLAARMGDPGFVKRFMQAGRPGIYLRVRTPGRLTVGERFALEPYPGPQVTTVEMFRDWHKKLGRPELERYLAVPIDFRSRRYLEQKLGELTAAS
ncbi:MAG TPA: MOSC domain-containing protein [Pseudomonadales bacterium]